MFLTFLHFLKLISLLVASPPYSSTYQELSTFLYHRPAPPEIKGKFEHYCIGLTKTCIRVLCCKWSDANSTVWKEKWQFLDWWLDKIRADLGTPWAMDSKLLSVFLLSVLPSAVLSCSYGCLQPGSNCYKFLLNRKESVSSWFLGKMSWDLLSWLA